MTTLEIKWTVSRGRDTYGYNIVTLYADGVRMARCNGGGYDMEGTVLGSWLARTYADRLLKLRVEDMPAQSHYQTDQTRVCDEECKETWRKALMDTIAKGDDEALAFERSVELERFSGDLFECPRCGGRTRHSGDGRRVEDGRYFYGLTFHDPTFNPAKAVIGEGCQDRTLGDGAEGQTVEQAEAAGVSFGLERYQAFYSASSKVPTDRHIIPQIDGACGKSSVEAIARAIGISWRWVPVKSKKVSIYTVVDNYQSDERTLLEVQP